MRLSSWLSVGCLLAACTAGGMFLVACSDDTDTTPAPEPKLNVTAPPFDQPFDKLSDWHFFKDALTQEPADDLLAYDVIAPLFSDYTTKFRFMHVPEGGKITYSDKSFWEYPEGSVLVKTFAYAKDVRKPYDDLRLVETRVLFKEPTGWTQHTYVWNDEQTDATRLVAGKFIPIDFIGIDGTTVHNDYRVPNTNECKNCHKIEDTVSPLGPTTRELDREFDYAAGSENQLDHLVGLGWLDAPPPAAMRERLVNPYDAKEDLFLRVRSYWDANCSACHRVNGEASTSALLLDFHSTDPTDPKNTSANWGVCKEPTSAGQADCGLTNDVVPGEPDLSIMPCRMQSTDLEKRMPPLGSKVVHQEGLALIREWIASLPPDTCTPP